MYLYAMILVFLFLGKHRKDIKSVLNEKFVTI